MPPNGAIIINPLRGKFVSRLTHRPAGSEPEYRRSDLFVSGGVIRGKRGASVLEGCLSRTDFRQRLGRVVNSFIREAVGRSPNECRVFIELPGEAASIPWELRDIAIAAVKNKRLLYLPDRANFRLFCSGRTREEIDQVFSCRSEEMELIPEKNSFMSHGAAIAVPLLNFPELRDIYDSNPRPIGDVQVVGVMVMTGPKNFLSEWAHLVPLLKLGIHAGLLFFHRHLTA